MSETSLLNELQDMCGSNKLHKCIKFLYSQEVPLDEAMIMWLGEQRNELRRNVDKRTERMTEVLTLKFDEEESVDDSYESLREVQVIKRHLLESFTGILVEVRALITKEHAIAIMEKYH